jgi:hypothetical protein
MLERFLKIFLAVRVSSCFSFFVMKNKANIEAALKVLIVEGKKSFNLDYSPSNAECIAMAISAVESDPTFTLEIAASHAEDWNFHAEVALIRKMINQA